MTILLTLVISCPFELKAAKEQTALTKSAHIFSDVDTAKLPWEIFLICEKLQDVITLQENVQQHNYSKVTQF